MIELMIYLITLHILAIVRRFHVIYVQKLEAIMVRKGTPSPSDMPHSDTLSLRKKA